MPQQLKTKRPVGPAEAARLAAGLTAEQAAKIVGVSVRYLRSVELGSRPPTYILAETLSNIYAVHGNPCGINPFFLPGKQQRATRRNEDSQSTGAQSNLKSESKEVDGKASKRPKASGKTAAGRCRRPAADTSMPRKAGRSTGGKTPRRGTFEC